MKGIGCYVWDTPEILRAKKSYDLQSEVSKKHVILELCVCLWGFGFFLFVFDNVLM